MALNRVAIGMAWQAQARGDAAESVTLRLKRFVRSPAWTGDIVDLAEGAGYGAAERFDSEFIEICFNCSKTC